ncbi:unnamed protein product [Moneuplotes crassus]|uniref:Uncharacterized protein n=1 Tax=Euplotes crassus TaxID=5936 RepID=A0AAD1UP46_EUPCR|nr:unnamed protein product [Moneuplotes crassus]
MKRKKGLARRAKNKSILSKNKRSSMKSLKKLNKEAKEATSPVGVLSEAKEVRCDIKKGPELGQLGFVRINKPIFDKSTVHASSSKKQRAVLRRKQSSENIQPQQQFVETRSSMYNNFGDPYGDQDYYHTIKGDFRKQIIREKNQNIDMLLTQQIPKSKLLRRMSDTKNMENHFDQSTPRFKQQDYQEENLEDVPTEKKQLPKLYHYSDIRNRTFCVKFLEKKDLQVSSALIDIKSDLSTEKLVSKVNKERNKILDEISYDEEVVEDAKTVQTSSDSDVYKPKKDHETWSQILEKVSRKLSQYSFEPGSQIDLDGWEEGDCEGIRLNDIVPGSLQ